MGGLASQIHKYAIGKALAEKHQVPLFLDLSWFKNAPEEDTKWPYHLDKYSIEYQEADVSLIKDMKPSKFMVSFVRRFNRLFKTSLKFKNYSSSSFMEMNEFSDLPSSLYLEGEWVGSSYFQNIREILLGELVLTQDLSDEAIALGDRIKNTDSVSVHFRRGDYLTNKAAANFHSELSLNYYVQAIDLMKKKYRNLHLYVFSDDIEWVKLNVDFDCAEVTFINSLPEYEEFHLISLCKSNIIANSSFSWLASWLNENSDKSVIAPNSWVKDKEINNIILKSYSNEDIKFLESN